MAKTATKRKEFSVSSIRRRLSAALIMLLVSSIMLVATTYAWFTLSTAPEVKNIDTTVAGNGSLEIALVPASGELTGPNGITSGRNSSGVYAGGNQPAETANNRWGNLIDISGDSYGLNKLELIPATAKIDGTTFSFGVPEFGKDGRITTTTSSASNLKAYNVTENKFNVANAYGVRAFVSSETAGSNGKFAAYGYVLDLAFRTNAAGNLILEKEALNRIYQGVMEDNALMGGGSKVTGTSDDVKIAFVQNYGVVADPAPTAQFLAFAKPGAGTGELTLYSVTGTTETAIDGNVLLENMAADTPIQISVVVWLEGKNLTNEDLAPEFDTNGDPVVSTATLNLQFKNSTDLIPMEESTLKTNPPVSKAEQLAAKITEAQAAFDAAAEGQAKTDLGDSITAARALGADATAEQIDAAIADLTAKIAAINA